MNRLQTELHRLYLAHTHQSERADHACTDLDLVDENGRVRAMVLEVAQAAGCDWMPTLWQGIQEDLNLPAPAVAVSGGMGYQVWFSLAESVPVAQTLYFLESLRLRYLGQVALRHISMKPVVDATAPRQAVHAKLVPAPQVDTGRWSAYVAPGLASMFADEPWLDVPPGLDAQANLLSGVKSINTADFHRALHQLQPTLAPTATKQGSANADTVMANNQPPSTKQAPVQTGCDPKEFLLSVMNDPAVELHLRIEAAKALLPLFLGGCGD